MDVVDQSLGWKLQVGQQNCFKVVFFNDSSWFVYCFVRQDLDNMENGNDFNDVDMFC